ncbi:beta-glucosidase [Thermophagus xiamenensis]|uniref:beta-glucosidase n=2 Tax=Thermophagus xiamenensis TaxID=385682 RepID=A0A1I2BW06_9BACT|nr:beta-glucosidase [Thermophagus xiamenensis]
MKFKGLIFFAFLSFFVFYGCSGETTSGKSSGEMEQKIEALLSEMTLDEKIGQMCQVDPGVFGTEEEVIEAVRKGQLGSLLNLIGAGKVNEIQRIAVEESRLGIPLIIGRDVIHGYRTIFPIPLGMAASWNEDLIREAASIAAKEAASEGINWTFAPMIDVSRDPRWGRIAESGGEDPLLNAMIARAMVQGFQGDDLANPLTIAACAKHYIGYGAAEGGRDYNTTMIPDIELYNVYLPPYRAAVNAGVATVMTAFNEINGIPASGHQRNVRGILKKDLGFDGFVVSDWASIQEMIDHGFAADEKHAAQLGIAAGVDMEMSSRTYANHLKALVEEGKVKMEWIDDAVRRILRVKFRLGLFDNPYVDESLADSVLVNPRHLEVARKLAEESIVLLKNKNELLPLKKGTKVALIGPMADQPYEQLGTWIFDGNENDSKSVLDAFYEYNGANNTFFAEGLAYTRDKSTKGFRAVERAIAQADVVVAVVGEEAILSGEAKSLAELDFVGAQNQLLELAASKGKPLIMVVMSGRPGGLYKTRHLADAILYAWHPGTMAGPAIVNLIFGEAVPSAKLPVTFPKGEGQVPIYYAHKMSGRPADSTSWTYIDDIPVKAVQHSLGNTNHTLDYGFKPLYPFGYGLSYTTFEYSDISLSAKTIQIGDVIKVSATITNTGKREGTEIVQLYVRDLVGSYTRPVRELKDFKRITLKPGESERVTFELNSSQLGFYHPNGRYVIEPGDFHVWIAPNAADGLMGKFRLE